jgi:hypothetical protein
LAEREQAVAQILDGVAHDLVARQRSADQRQNYWSETKQDGIAVNIAKLPELLGRRQTTEVPVKSAFLH